MKIQMSLRETIDQWNENKVVHTLKATWWWVLLASWTVHVLCFFNSTESSKVLNFNSFSFTISDIGTNWEREAWVHALTYEL